MPRGGRQLQSGGMLRPFLGLLTVLCWGEAFRVWQRNSLSTSCISSPFDPTVERQKECSRISSRSRRSTRCRFSLALSAKKKKTNAKKSLSLDDEDENDDEVQHSGDLDVDIEGVRNDYDDEGVVDEVPADEGDKSVELPELSKQEIVEDMVRKVVRDNNANLCKVDIMHVYIYVRFCTRTQIKFNKLFHVHKLNLINYFNEFNE